ncbi:unnamed protein product [Somion occarium]|uniref:MYND-type domain-containing protein n=1 Tax=Somion occarium TaxID=3059160 RepID=A0ABP1DFW5_9APHY
MSAVMDNNEPEVPGPFLRSAALEIGDTSFLEEIAPLRREGDQLFSRKVYQAALGKFKKTARVIVGDGFEIPLYCGEGGGFRSKKYMEMKQAKRLALMECCVQIARCLRELEDYEQSLIWVEEVEVIVRNLCFSNTEAMFDWHADLPRIEWNPNDGIEQFYVQRVRALCLASDNYLSLWNTGTAAQRRHLAYKITQHLPPNVNSITFRGIVSSAAMFLFYQFRHPDPQMTKDLMANEESLQVMGSWSKIEVQRDRNIPPRFGFASFIWKGRYYIVGGEKSHSGPYYKDMHYIELSNVSTGWHDLPSYPGDMIRVSGWKIGVYQDKAYFFNGRPQLDYFDLVTERWGSVRTRPADRQWPYPEKDFMDYAGVLVKSKFYVFGGTHGNVTTGCNLFMVLDLSDPRLEWKKLTGHASQPLVPDWNCPGPRRHPTIWADERVPGSERIYLMFGEADRAGAKFRREPQGSSESYSYGDFWSWDVNQGGWRRERMVGNPPCARSEMAYTFKLGMAFVFGGYSPSLPADYVEEGKKFSFTYFADTFIYIPPSASSPSATSAPKWKHVLTRGFPTYRAQAQLFTDPDTGKIYLFGGYTNSQFVPDKKHEISRSFSDVWQLKINIPGGYFDDVDLEEETKTAMAGPWQRCFNCGNAGRWKKCGGSCGGRAFFCDSQCMKEGWKEHKERHHCANVRK